MCNNKKGEWNSITDLLPYNGSYVLVQGVEGSVRFLNGDFAQQKENGLVINVIGNIVWKYDQNYSDQNIALIFLDRSKHIIGNFKFKDSKEFQEADQAFSLGYKEEVYDCKGLPMIKAKKGHDEYFYYLKSNGELVGEWVESQLDQMEEVSWDNLNLRDFPNETVVYSYGIGYGKTIIDDLVPGEDPCVEVRFHNGEKFLFTTKGIPVGNRIPLKLVPYEYDPELESMPKFWKVCKK